MKRKINSILIMFILIYIEFVILTNSNIVLSSVLFSFNIWKNNIFPSLFPMFILSNILINYGFVELFGEIFKPLMRLFRINPKCSFIFVMSIISGFPSNAKYTRDLYQNGVISKSDAAKILMISHFSNPLFIIGTVALTFYNDKRIGIIILLSHYIGNILLGIIFRNYEPYKGDYKVSLKNGIISMHNKRISNCASFSDIITNSIFSTINTLLLILGTVTIFLITTSLLSYNLSFNSLSQSVISGLFEITQGLKYVSMENISICLKIVISTMLLSFGGISVHFQVKGILSDTDIPYKQYFFSRVIHAVISGIISYFLFNL